MKFPVGSTRRQVLQSPSPRAVLPDPPYATNTVSFLPCRVFPVPAMFPPSFSPPLLPASTHLPLPLIFVISFPFVPHTLSLSVFSPSACQHTSPPSPHFRDFISFCTTHTL